MSISKNHASRHDSSLRVRQKPRHAAPTLAALAVAGCALSGCQTWDAAAPPGREAEAYQGCLATIDYGPENNRLTGYPPLARLTAAIARGDGLTADNPQADIHPPPAKPPATADELRAYENAPFQQFLDCYMRSHVDTIDYEARLVRGHIALTMIAGYSATVIDAAPAAKKSQYAKSALAMITAAELSLKSASWIEYQYAKAGKAAPSKTPPTRHPPMTPCASPRMSSGSTTFLP